MGIVTPQGSPLEIASDQLAIDGPSRASNDEIVVLHEPYLPLTSPDLDPKPTSSPVSVTRVNSTVARVLDAEPLSVNTLAHPIGLSQAPSIEGLIETAMTSLAIDYEHRSAGSLSITESIEYSTQDNNSVLALSAIALADAAVEDPTESGNRAEPLVWKDIANWLNANAAKAAESDAAAAKEWNNENSDNLAIAEMARATGIRRPQLPPLQRARPLQRAAILPPRVRPLGL